MKEIAGLAQILAGLNAGTIKYSDLLDSIHEGAEIKDSVLISGKSFISIKPTGIGVVGGKLCRKFEAVGEKIHADGTPVVRQTRNGNGAKPKGKK